MFARPGSATECYACSPTKDNDYCLTVSATTPIVDAKNSLGCLKITGDGNKRREAYNRILFNFRFSASWRQVRNCEHFIQRSEQLQ